MQEHTRHIQLLLAEDDAISRRFLEDALALDGFAVTSTDRGDSALQLARQRRFSALLLDRNLPGLDGICLLRALRADPLAGSHSTPAIALSAEIGGAAGLALEDAGFDRVLGKPLQIAMLRDALGSLLPSASPLLWNDRQALAAAGGQRQIVDALRRLLRRDLPTQRQTVIDALARGEPDAAELELHKLRAAAGFCGAEELAAAVVVLSSAPDSLTARSRFERACLAIEAESD